MSQITAWLSVFFMALAAGLAIIKLINKAAKKKNWESLIPITQKSTGFFIKYHKDIFYYAILFGWIHSLYEIIQRGFLLSGIILWAGLLLLLWTGMQKHFHKNWIWSHRVITAGLLVLTAMHWEHPGFLNHFFRHVII